MAQKIPRNIFAAERFRERITLIDDACDGHTPADPPRRGNRHRITPCGPAGRPVGNMLVTPSGRARWATVKEMAPAGLFRPRGVFLGGVGDAYLRHDGPEHVMCFAPTRSGKGVGLVLPVGGGTLIGKAGLENQVESFVYAVPIHDGETTMSRAERFRYARDQVTEIIHRVWPYVLVGVGIGALIHNWIPEATITALVGQDKW